MHVDPDVVIATELSLPGVETDPDPYGGLLRPRMALEFLLDSYGRLDRFICSGEDDEEGIADSADFRGID